MNALRRWFAAAFAIVLFTTATLHILSHPDLNESSCVVCHMQEASLPGAPAPTVAVAEVLSSPLAELPAPRTVPLRTVAAAARAPPAVRA